MKFTLMHKNTGVAELEIDEEICAISKIGEISNPAHLPVGLEMTKGRPNRHSLNEWWTGRAIPASRSGLADALEYLRVSSPKFLLTKCFGLSLSDQYWVRPANKNLNWSDVNFFENSFSEDVGNILFGHVPEDENIDLMSPNNTSDGWLKKKWIIADGKRILLKSGSGDYCQEPFNEVLATAIMRRLEVPHVPYTLAFEGGEPLSVCEDFITSQTELISAWHLRSGAKKPGHLSEYQHYINCCEKLGISGAVDGINKMLTVDFLIMNEDRHMNNFGAVRNAETLKWQGLSPIFDSGTSLWYNTIHVGSVTRESKPFRNRHSEQIKLVTNFDWLNFGALRGIDEEFSDILNNSEYIDDRRRSALCNALKMRVEMLQQIVQEQTPVHGIGIKMQ